MIRDSFGLYYLIVRPISSDPKISQAFPFSSSGWPVWMVAPGTYPLRAMAG